MKFSCMCTFKYSHKMPPGKRRVQYSAEDVKLVVNKSSAKMDPYMTIFFLNSKTVRN
jgi:hypothetical protein